MASIHPLTPEQQLIKSALLEEIMQCLPPKISLGPPLLKAHEVRRKFNISRNTLSILRKKGILPAVKIGANYRYKLADILQYLSENETAHSRKAATPKTFTK